MQHWIVYWKNDWEEKDDPSLVTPDRHSSHDHFYEEAAVGDEVWVVVAGPASLEDQWRLLERFTLHEKRTIDAVLEGYSYLFLGTPQAHQVFDPRAPSDLTAILTSLDFASDRPITLSGRQIGQALQSPRKLTPLDARKLTIHAEGLPVVIQGAHGAA